VDALPAPLALFERRPPRPTHIGQAVRGAGFERHWGDGVDIGDDLTEPDPYPSNVNLYSNAVMGIG